VSQSLRGIRPEPRQRRAEPRLAIAVAVALAGLADSAAHAQTTAEAPPPTVVVAPVVLEDVTPSYQYVGRIQAIQTLNLVARVEGFLDAVEFQEGAHIKAGQRLYQIEKAPFQAALDQANAQVASAQAQLAGAEATLTNTQLTLDRQKALVKGGTVSQAVVDTAQADRDKAAADVEAAKAAIQEALAQVETAKLNLGYTDISSTIDGRIGKTNVTQGNLVNTATGTLATIVQIDPMRVVFSIAESQYVEVAKTVNPGTSGPSGAFVPTLLLADGSTYDKPGKIAFIGNEIDASTGTLPVYADFANAEQLLLPGGFVTVTVKQGKEVQAPVVAASAVLEDKDGQYVFTVDSSNKAIQARIKTSEQVGTNLVVTSGLKVGDIVVTEGIQRVRPGIVVTPQPAAAAGAAASSSGAPAATTSGTSGN